MAPNGVLAGPRIVLYAAHGGDDTGVSGKGQLEKTWNLKVAQSLQKALSADGFDVVMVRTKDESIPDDQWVAQANGSGAGAVLVIHAEREWTGQMSGPLAVVEPPTSMNTPETQGIQRWGSIPVSRFRQSLRLAKALTQAWGKNAQLSNLSDSRALPGESISPDGRVLACAHQSLRYLILPAVVIEPLFLTSSQDLKRMSNDEGLQDFVSKTALGLHSFFSDVPLKGFTNGFRD